MYINPDFTAGIIPIAPTGTNSTMFTECCEAAICDDERVCPVCKRNIVGYDAEGATERGKIRWRNATKRWKRDKYGAIR